MLPALLLLGCAHKVSVEALPAPQSLEIVTVRREYANVHAVVSPQGTVLIDTGLEREAEGLLEELEAAGVPVATIDLVVVTHGHADHAGGAGRLQRVHGIPIVAGQGDVGDIAHGHNGELCPTGRLGERRVEDARKEAFEPFTPDHVVTPDAPMVFDVLGVDAVVRAVPGHTPGSLVVEIGDALFVGDLIRGSFLGQSARTHLFQCDLDDNRRDVAALLEESTATRWFVGHFGPLSRASVRRWLDR